MNCSVHSPAEVRMLTTFVILLLAQIVPLCYEYREMRLVVLRSRIDRKICAVKWLLVLPVAVVANIWSTIVFKP